MISISDFGQTVTADSTKRYDEVDAAALTKRMSCVHGGGIMGVELGRYMGTTKAVLNSVSKGQSQPSVLAREALAIARVLAKHPMPQDKSDE